MKVIKKIEFKVIQTFVMSFIIILFLFVCYNFYITINDYAKFKKKDFKNTNIIKKIKPLAFFNFNISTDQKNKFNIFSYNKKIVRKSKKIKKKETFDFIIAGVVKKDKLYLVGKLKSDKNLSLFSENELIKNYTIKKIYKNRIIIIDELGNEKIIKIFKFDNIVNIKKKKPEVANDKKE